MAKSRRTKAAPEGDSVRAGPVSREQLATRVALMEQLHGELAAMLRTIDDLELETVEIDGVGLFDRGADAIDRYIANLEKGVSKARRLKRRADLEKE